MKGAIDVTSGAVDAFNFELITTNARDSGSRLIGTLIALADACPPLLSANNAATNTIGITRTKALQWDTRNSCELPTRPTRFVISRAVFRCLRAQRNDTYRASRGSAGKRGHVNSCDSFLDARACQVSDRSRINCRACSGMHLC